NEPDVTDKVEIAMAGKTIIEKEQEQPLDYVIDRFDDVRHIFKLPEIIATGQWGRQTIKKVIFGEHDLFENLNVRRGALHGPVILPLNPPPNVYFEKSEITKTLDAEHFRRPTGASEVPTTRGQYRLRGSDNSVDIFLQRNVYPFGVIGMPHPKKTSAGEIICLSSGGLSGRVGNTLEGITRVMYDFLACSDAMVLDEGLDVFQLVNPFNENGIPKYTNEEILDSIALRVRELVDEEQSQYEKGYQEANGTRPTKQFRDIELNRALFEAVFKHSVPNQPLPDEIFPVRLQRSQIRAVLIFARKMDEKAGRPRDEARRSQ
ncbi:MAG TPA: hypothetical protein VFV34_25400, partial [Blastocatellia bacterium]|nr:hypothetical protein [Blastocatellia bacterium]